MSDADYLKRFVANGQAAQRAVDEIERRADAKAQSEHSAIRKPTRPSFAQLKAAAAAGTLDRVKELARNYYGRADRTGVLSTGERCAVALLCNDADMLPAGYTWIDAVHRLDDRADRDHMKRAHEGDWLSACLRANREGWRE